MEKRIIETNDQDFEKRTQICKEPRKGSGHIGIDPMLPDTEKKKEENKPQKQ